MQSKVGLAVGLAYYFVVGEKKKRKAKEKNLKAILKWVFVKDFLAKFKMSILHFVQKSLNFKNIKKYLQTKTTDKPIKWITYMLFASVIKSFFWQKWCVIKIIIVIDKDLGLDEPYLKAS